MADNGKTKFDYEIEEFEQAFDDKRDKRIAIYGTGRMTATLLGRIKGFNIVGLLDREEALIGSKQYGVEIISREAAERNADLIIINTAENYWRTIYNRIKDWNIPIYFRNGRLAAQSEKENRAADEYFNKSYDELRQKAEKYDVISFDVFDTLIMRKIYLPSDIFGLVDKKIKGFADTDVNFAETRRKAAALSDNQNIDEIYSKIQEMTGWDVSLMEKVKQCELETDLKLISARNVMTKLCRELMQEKEVWLVSDMYYTADYIKKILHYNGLDIDSSRIIVSCDCKRSKEDGSLWEFYRQNVVKGRSALHIGDNEKSDCMRPKEYGIDTYYIRSAGEMMANSSLMEILPKVNSLYASLAAGMIAVKIFNNPFTNTGGGVKFNDEKEAGYCLLGSLCCSFMHWLMKNSVSDGVEEIVFFAREGYLLIEQYRYMCSLLRERKFPEAVYMEISRRAVINAAIEVKDDIYEAAMFPYTGNLSGFLHDRFRVESEDEETLTTAVIDIQKDRDTLEKALGKYADEIYRKASEEREGYLKYISKLGLMPKIGVVDSLLYGNTQYYLGKIMKQKMNGYYFCACLDNDNKCCRHQNMKGCFQNQEDTTGKQSKVWKNSNFIEAFFTSPNGMLIFMNSDANAEYAAPMSNQKAFGVRLEMQEGIFEFMREIVDIQEKIAFDDLCNDTGFAEDLFGCFMDGGFEPSDKMKKSFYYDNGILNNKEVPIWE